MNRRRFLAALAGLPLVGAALTKAAAKKPELVAGYDLASGPDKSVSYHAVNIGGAVYYMPAYGQPPPVLSGIARFDANGVLAG